jgi:hypothetical protein
VADKLTFLCPECSTRLAVDAQQAERTKKCPRCRTRFTPTEPLRRPVPAPPSPSRFPTKVLAGVAVACLVALPLLAHAIVQNAVRAAEKRRNAGIEDALVVVRDRLRTLARAEEPPAYAAADARSALEKYGELDLERCRLEATGWFSGFSAHAYTDARTRSVRRDLGESQPAMELILRSSVRRKLKAGTPQGGLLEAVKGDNGGLNRELIIILGKIRNLSALQVQDELLKGATGPLREGR